MSVDVDVVYLCRVELDHDWIKLCESKNHKSQRHTRNHMAHKEYVSRNIKEKKSVSSVNCCYENVTGISGRKCRLTYDAKQSTLFSAFLFRVCAHMHMCVYPRNSTNEHKSDVDPNRSTSTLCLTARISVDMSSVDCQLIQNRHNMVHI